jgi:hypothetical protein
MGAPTVMDLEIWKEGAEEAEPVRADQRDMAAFERKHSMGTARAIDDATVIFQRYIAWAALRRLGRTDQAYDAWDATVISVEEPDEEAPQETVDPTPPAL